MSRIPCARWLLLAIVGVAVGCGEGTSAPVAGMLRVELSTPNSGADGAMLLTITGPAALTSATPERGLRLFAQPLGDTTTRVALTGVLNAGAIITIGVADVAKARQYRATIQSAAAADFQLRTLAGYSLTVAK